MKREASILNFLFFIAVPNYNKHWLITILTQGGILLDYKERLLTNKLLDSEFGMFFVLNFTCYYKFD